MNLRTLFFGIILCFSAQLYAQVKDDFTDGDFTNDPAWSGDVSEFQVTNNQLNSNGPDATAELYLSTANTILDNVVWEFYIEMGFAPSGSNRTRVYLVSDDQNLESTLNGYYLEIGQSGDDYLILKRSDSGTETTIITGTTAFVDQVRVQVTRSHAGDWTLSADHSGGRSFSVEGSTTDNTYTSTGYFGIVVDHTSTRKDLFFFDDFIVDQVQVDSVQVISNTSLDIYLNQKLDQTAVETTANYSIAGVAILSATQDATNQQKVTLTLDGTTPLTTGDYTLTVSSTLTKNLDATAGFSYTALDLQSLLTLSDSEIELQFNDSLKESSAETLTHYSIDNGIGQPITATLDAADPTKVTLTLGNSLFEGTIFQLSISNLDNSSQNSTFFGTKNFTFVVPLVLDSVGVMNKNQLMAFFNKSLDQALAETVSNYSVDQSFGQPTTAVLQSDNKSVLLTFAGDLQDQHYTLTATSLKDTDGNAISSSNSYSFDYLPLKIISITKSGDLEFKVQFNQNVDQSSAETVSNYSLSEIGVPTSASQSASDEVTLTFSELYNNDYELTINGIENETQNATADNLIAAISVQQAVDYRYLIINEIMADPTPSQGLPDAEYVEIYNPSENAINLKDFELNGRSVGKYILAAGDYILLTDRTDSAAFGLTNSLGISSFDALTNGGDYVKLVDALGNVVDSLTYDLSWYGDDEKKDGGYSLELIDPLKTCLDATNWIASNASKGGTPGAQNSVYNISDSQPPSVKSIVADGDNAIKVTFSEALDTATVRLSDFEITGYTFTSIQTLSFSEFHLDLNTDLVSEQYYDFTIATVSDCRGNELTSQTKRFYHDTKPPVLEEIRIVSNQEIAMLFSEDLKSSIAEDENNYSILGLTVDHAYLQDSSTNRVHVSFDEQFILDSTYTINYSNLQDTLGNALSASSQQFIYENQVDTAYVIAPNLLALRFKAEPTQASVENVTNFLFDNTGKNPEEAAQDDSDKHLVRLGFAENFDDNKDLLLYISNIRSASDNSLFATPAYTFQYDTRAATLTSLLVKNDSQLVITWSEPMDLKTTTTSAYYYLEDDEQPVEIVSMSADTFELTFENKFEMEVQKTLSVKSVKDRNGVEVTTTRKMDFVYDPRPPQIESVMVISDTQLQIVYSEKVDFSSSTTLANYSLNAINPIQSSILGPDSTTVTLTFTGIAQQESLTFTAANIADKVGNTIEGDTLQINTLNPHIVDLEALNDSTLLLTYSQAMSTNAFESESYQLHDLDIDVVSKADDYSAKISLAQHLEKGDSLILTTSGIAGSNGAKLQMDSFKSVFNPYLKDVEIVDDQTVLLSFDTKFSSISKSDFTISGNTISIVILDGEDKGTVRLSLSTALPENVSFKLNWQGLSDAYGRSLPDYFADLIIDTKKPEITGLTSDFFGKLKLTFSESMDENSLSSINKFKLISLGYPVSIVVTEDDKISLDFNDQLSLDQEYELIIYPLADLSGNYSDQDTIAFTYSPPALPNYQDIVISEIMADPTPVIDLPDVEYVELYNASGTDYHLIGLILNSAALPDYVLGSGEYVLLVSDGNAGLFDMENVAEMNLPTLSNSGDELTLKTIRDGLVDEVNYDISWYGDSQKNDGGYSLELIDPLGTCNPAVNWTASKSDKGGTPGAQNSVYRIGKDDDLPLISSFTAVSTNEFSIGFSESMDSLSLTAMTISLDNFSVDTRIVSGVNFTGLNFTISEGIQVGQLYELSLSGASDCSGNLMADTTLQIGFGKTPEKGELLITEIMADPDPPVGLPNSEYVEVYNKSDLLLNLAEVVFKDSNSARLLPDVNIPVGTYAILCPVAVADTFSTYGFTIGLSSWPSLTNSGEHISLITTEVLASVTYSNDWFTDPDKADGGYSLELINPQSDCPGSANWEGSTDESGGTPGKQNSVYSLNPDGEVPSVASLKGQSTRRFTLVFDEAMDSLSLLQTTLELTGYTIMNRQVLDDMWTTLQFDLDQELQLGSVYKINISGASDCSGNLMSDTTLQIGFGKPPNKGELLITEIMADPDPPVGLPNSEYVEIYNNSDLLLNLAEVVFKDSNSDRLLPDVNIPAGTYAILCPEAVVDTFSIYGLAIGVSNWPSLTNAGEEISFSASSKIASVTYSNDWFSNQDQADGGYSLELINPQSDCPGSANWEGSSDPSGGTPGRKNSVYNLDPDNEPPVVSSFVAISTDSLLITFNEAMDSTSLMSAIISEVSIKNRKVQDNLHEQLLVVLETGLELGRIYNIEISEASDCSGNVMSTESFQVGFGDLPGYNELIISEIMADSEPVVGLPNSEYLEVYNASDRLISLRGLTLKDNTSETTLPAAIIPSGGYLLLLPTGAVGDFEIKNKVGVSGWLSLNNSGETLSIWNDENLVFDISYSDSWYSSSETGSGGFSLEMKDLTNPCGGAQNWGSSTSSLGGTPGLPNANSESVPDNFGPNLLRGFAITKDTIELVFDEGLVANGLDDVSLAFDPKQDYSALIFGESRANVFVKLKSELKANQTYTVTVDGATDCNGNEIRKNQVDVVLPDEPESGDVVLNEILFNPKSGGVDFIELYNKSEKYLDLNAWGLARRTEALDIQKISEKYILEPQAYVAITTDTTILKNQYPKTDNLFEVSSLPTMSNDEGDVVILLPNDSISDEFHYLDSYHLRLLQSVDGVSLERISVDKPTQDPNNWTSASSAVGFATPGYENSQSFDVPVATAEVSVDPKVFVPNSSNPAFQSFTTINYEFDKSGQYANVIVYNQLGEPVAQLAKGATLSTTGFIRWDGTSITGDKVRMGYYVVFFEVYDNVGNKQVLKETVVVGR